MSYRAIADFFDVKSNTPMVRVVATCNTCHKTETLLVPESGWLSWHDGVLIQRALPDLTKEQRELLISGTCGPCFEEIFAEP